MESLALLVSVIVSTIIVLGMLAVFTLVRTPRSTAGRAVTMVINAMGLLSGAWLASVDVGMGTRLTGLAVFAASAVSVVRVLRAR